MIASRAVSTLEIARPGTRAARQRSDLATASSRAGTVLIGLLSAIVLYAAFDHGAQSVAAQARLQAAVAVVAVAVAVVAMWSGWLRFGAPSLALCGLAALLAFAAWSGLTLVWSVAPEQTWTELNRALTYALVLTLAIVAGSSHRRAAELAAGGALVAVLAVTIYALGQKLFPGIHIAGVFNLNQTQLVPRLQEPFGYWNALGLFVALGIPLALAVAMDRIRAPRLRLTALVAMELMTLVVGFTYSRGALLALVCGLIVAMALNRAPLRTLMWLAAAWLAAVPPLVVGFTSHSLTDVSVSLAQRERAGLVLAGVLALSVLGLWAVGRLLLGLERRVEVGPQQARRLGRALAGLVVLALLGAVIAVALSGRGLPGTISHAWTSFTTTRAISNYNPGRLLSADSANRWVWWKEAVNAFGHRPLGGWGAGSFGVVHLLYRTNQLSVQQPHSVPLEFLSDTGIVGALLALAAFASLLAAAIGGVRRLGGRERVLAAAVGAGVVICGIHALYDWDWDIPGVTLPALLFTGVLVGARRRRPKDGVELSAFSRPQFAWKASQLHGRLVARSIGLALVTAALCAFVLSGVVQSAAASKASAALVTASSGSRSAVRQAQADAVVATRLDPLSDAGPLASESIAVRLGNPQEAQRYALQAVRRDPDDVQGWERLLLVELALHNAVGSAQAAQRVIKLDPQSSLAKLLVRALSH